MQPIDRDTQIKLMTDIEARLDARVEAFLRVPAIADAAKRCAFDASPAEFTTKRVRIARSG